MRVKRSYPLFAIALSLLLLGANVNPGWSQSRRQPPSSNEKKNKRPDPTKPGENQQPLFQSIVDTIPKPTGDPEGPLQILVANLDYSDYLGRLAIARAVNGTLRIGEEVSIVHENETRKTKITKQPFSCPSRSSCASWFHCAAADGNFDCFRYSVAARGGWRIAD